MDRQQKKLISVLVLGSLFTATVGAVVWSIVWPVPMPQASGAATSAVVGANADSAMADAQALDATSRANDPKTAESTNRGLHWVRRLRRNRPILNQLSVEPLPSSESVDANALGAEIKLIGTVLEEGHSFAVIADALGTIDLQPAGGTLQIDPSGIRVESVSRDSATVSLDGKKETLFITKIESKGNEDDLSEPAMAQDLDAVQGMSIEEENDWMNGAPTMQPVDDSNNQDGGS